MLLILIKTAMARDEPLEWTDDLIRVATVARCDDNDCEFVYCTKYMVSYHVTCTMNCDIHCFIL